MSRLLRRATPVALAAGCLFAGAAPASAATITTPNACKGEDGQVGNLPLQLTAAATQTGRTLNLGSTQPGVEVPDWLKSKLQPAALALGPGAHNITLEAWMALAADGSTTTPQVRTSTGTIRVDVSWGFQVTNVTVSLSPLASSSWSAVAEGGTLTVKQAGPGTLSAIPGTTTNPAGSLFIRGTARALGQTVTLTFDCQPGTNGAAPDVLNTSLVPGPATPLASADFAPAPAQPDSPTPPVTPAPTPAPSPAPAPAPAPAPSPMPSPTPPPSANPAPAPSPGATPNGAPVTKPTVTAAAKVKRAKAVKGLRFRVRGGKSGSTYNGVLKVGNRGGKAKGKLDASGSALINLKLPAAQRKKVKKGTKLTLAINVTTTDGSVVKLTRTIVVR